MIPFSHHLNEPISHNGEIYFSIDNNYKTYTGDEKNVIEKIIMNISTLFKTFFPEKELILKSENIGNEKYFLSLYTENKNLEIPTNMESTGILKIISILSFLVFYTVDENSIVVIDDLDAHLYEYLLSKFLYSINQVANGQLIFTSHYLALMESSKRENIIISSKTDDVLFTYFKKVSKTENMRDKYIRSQSLGAEDNINAIDVDEDEIKYAVSILKEHIEIENSKFNLN